MNPKPPVPGITVIASCAFIVEPRSVPFTVALPAHPPVVDDVEPALGSLADERMRQVITIGIVAQEARIRARVHALP